MKNHPSLQTGLTLIEITLALLISAIVGYFAILQASQNSIKQTSYLQGTALNDVRKAMDSYVKAYSVEIIGNTDITAIAGSTISKTPGTSSCTTAGYGNTTRCPTVDTLITLKLLPSGFKSALLSGNRSLSICGYDSSFAWTETNGTQTCSPIFSGATCSVTFCKLSGFVYFTTPFKTSGQTSSSVGYDGDSIMYILERTEGRGAFSRRVSANLRVQGDNDVFVPNVVGSSGMVAAVFGTVKDPDTRVQGVDFCPGASVTLTADSTKTPVGTVVLNDANATPVSTASNGIVFASLEPANYNCSNNGKKADCPSGTTKLTCATALVYGDAEVGGTSQGSGFASGSNANNTGVIQVSCISENGVAKPFFRIFTCK